MRADFSRINEETISQLIAVAKDAKDLAIAVYKYTDPEWADNLNNPKLPKDIVDAVSWLSPEIERLEALLPLNKVSLEYESGPAIATFED